jgi:hypothetical protein
MNKMFLYSTSGNLGIGERFSASDVPNQKLDVDGNANFRGQLIMDNTEGDNEVVFPNSESLSLTFQVRENGRGHRLSVEYPVASSVWAGQPDWAILGGRERLGGCGWFSPQRAPAQPHPPSNSTGARTLIAAPPAPTVAARRMHTARATRRGYG